MASYVDGFVFTVPKKNLKAYKKMATEACTVWKKFGALDYKECVIDDAKPHPGMKMTFAKITGAKPSDLVFFSFITYRSKKQRDAVNKKVMAYFDKKYEGKQEEDMPFDMSRMAFAGFQTIVEKK